MSGEANTTGLGGGVVVRNSGSSAEERVKLFKLIRHASAPGSAGGTRSTSTYGDNQERSRRGLLKFAATRGLSQGFDDLVQDCLDDYDLSLDLRGRWPRVG